MGNFSEASSGLPPSFGKKYLKILRQPRLVATLVVGPFLILFIFGIGYRAQSPPCAHCS